MTVTQLGRLGGKARAAKHPRSSLRKWSAKGGKARAAKYTREQLRAFARNNRRPPKLAPEEEARLVEMAAQGKTHAQLAFWFSISSRTVGRILRRHRDHPAAKKPSL